MANRREEERERLREAREEREQEHRSSERKRLMVGYAIAGVVTLVIVAVVIVAVSSGGGGSSGNGSAHIDARSGSTNGVEPDERSGPKPAAVKIANLKQAARKAGCQVRLHLKDEGHEHLPEGSPSPEYKTNPPSSGNHVEPPFQQADGAYLEEPEKIDFVHSLEHGRLEIEYSPELSEADQLKLKGLYDTMYAADLLFPNDEMPYQVAAVTWTNMLTCKQFKGAATLDAIRDFGKKTWGKYGGEQVEGFPFTGPTPAEPEES